MNNLYKLSFIILSLIFASCGNEKPKSGKSTVFSDKEGSYQTSETAENAKSNDSTTKNRSETTDLEQTEASINFEVQREELEKEIDAAREKLPMQRLLVRGTMFNAVGTTITLDRLGGENNYEPLSTTMINTEGIFELSTQTNQQSIYQLRTDKGNIVLFIGPGNYDIKADLNDLNSYTVTNSPESKKLLEFYLMIESYNTKIQALQKRIKDTDNYDLVNNLLDSMPFYNEQIYQDKTKDIKNFINNNRNSLLATIACDKLDFMRNTNFALEIFEEQKDKFPHSSYVKAMGKKLIRFKPIALGQKAHDVVMSDINGKNYRLSDFKGKYVLLYIFIGYSKESVAYNKELINIYSRFKPDGFEVYGVTLDMTEEEWRSTVKDQNINFLTVGDMLGEKSVVFDQYLAIDVPMTYLIDPDGILIDKFLSPERLTSVLKQKLY